MAHSAVGAANNHAADRDCNGWRLPKAYRVCGADGLISQKRGWASNRKTPEDVRLAAIAIVKERALAGRPTKGMMHPGFRGVGKIVLLNRLLGIASDQEFQTAKIEAPEGGASR
jgi:hypothetical protein